MLTLDQHFSSGYLPALIGAYFNLAQLLSQNASSPVTEVRAAVVDEVPRLRQTGEFIKDKVRLVQALAELVGFTAPPPPRVPEEYYAWFEQVHAGFRAALVTHHRGEITQLFGHRGDIAREASLAHQPGQGEVRRQCASGDRIAVVNRLQ
jgi:hypothetical protein